MLFVVLRFRASIAHSVLIGVALALSGCSIPWNSVARGTSLAPISEDGSIDSSAEAFVPVSHPAPLPGLPLVITPEVQKELDRFTGNGARYVAESLARREKYYPTMVQIFRDEGLPLELINVALIESGFRPEARSRAGAVGIWQFMKSTARSYGLIITSKFDQRKDPILSTIAAARHLKDLYLQYQDWYLALAAYNAGPGAITRAMIRGKIDNYWELCRKKRIRLQTARYVPKIIAITLIVNDMTVTG